MNALPPLPLADRGRLYLDKMPSAVAGSGGHSQTFAAAVALVHGFGISEAEAWPILCDYSARCLPPWSEADLRHKLTTAGRLTRHPKPRGYLAGTTAPCPTASRPVSIPRPRPAAPEIMGFITLPPEILATGPTQSRDADTPLADPAPVAVNSEQLPPPLEILPEANRIAGELHKMVVAGALSGPADPDAEFFAGVMSLFNARFNGIKAA